MNVPLLDLDAQFQNYKNDFNDAIQEVINSQHFILGKFVEEFEKNISEYLNVKYSIGVASGSDALLLSYMALDINNETAVITTPYTFFSTTGSFVRLGAYPIFIDIEPDTYNININQLVDYLKQHTTYDKDEKCTLDKCLKKVIKAIVPVHLFGQCVDMDELNEIALRYNIPVIEDAAQAIGAVYNGKKAGSLSLAGCFSFYPSKNLGAWGDGGLVSTNDDKFAEKIKILRVHGAKKKYYHQQVGCCSRLDAIQANLLNAKLKYIDTWNKLRYEHALYYNEQINNELKPFIITPVIKPHRNHIFHQYVIRVEKKRDELIEYLKQNGIGTSIYYPIPLHLQECFSYLGYKKGDFPVTEQSAENSLALPMYPELTKDMQDYVIDVLKEFYKK